MDLSASQSWDSLTYVEVLSADNAIRDRLADPITNQIFSVMARLCCGVDGPETSVDRGVDQIGRAVLFPGCPVEEHWENGGVGVADGTQTVSLPHFSHWSSHVVMKVCLMKTGSD